MPESFMQVTRRLLKAHEKGLPDIYADLRNSGSEITFYWLRKFSSGDIKDPSVNRVEELYKYLTGKPALISA